MMDRRALGTPSDRANGRHFFPRKSKTTAIAISCGGCVERRAAIVSGARALIRGELSPAFQPAAVVANSAERDVRKIARAATHLRLKR
jgi:hypothetical protein